MFLKKSAVKMRMRLKSTVRMQKEKIMKLKGVFFNCTVSMRINLDSAVSMRL